MKTIRQLLRQPLKTIAGILLVTLAVSILSLSAGQFLAAENTIQTLDYQYTTVALPTKAYHVFSNGSSYAIDYSSQLPEEITQWLETVIAEHPELVIADARPGLASAYISELNSDIYVRHNYRHSGTSFIGSSIALPEGAPYSCAMLEITVTAVEPREEFDYDPETDTFLEVISGTTVRGTIDQVHALHEGFADPTGMTVGLVLNGVFLEDLSTTGLEVGRRYLVYGLDYYDKDWELRESIKVREYGNIVIDRFDPEALTIYTEEQKEDTNWTAHYKHEHRYIYLSQYRLEQFRYVELHDPQWIALTGSGEEFLSSQEGARWADYLDYAQINYHAFPLIGVDKLGYIANFAQGTARVVEGRDFTQEELDGGAKVCILSQSLAMANGLSVGDTINPRYYNFDPDMEGQYTLSTGIGTTEPAAYFYGETTPFAGEEETYTIIGLYRASEWQNPQDNLYSFTPNTIFVPKSSVTGTMDYGDQAFFRTIVLKNGAIEEFSRLVSEAGYDGLFVYYDQGYSEIADIFASYEVSAKRAALFGVLAYGVILLLFLLLFPTRHGKVLATMGSLGAERRQKFSHVFVSSLGLLAPGTILGAVAGFLLWEQVSDALLSASAVMLDVELSVANILPVALGQLALALCLVAVIALFASRKKNLMIKK